MVQGQGKRKVTFPGALPCETRISPLYFPWPLVGKCNGLPLPIQPEWDLGRENK